MSVDITVEQVGKMAKVSITGQVDEHGAEELKEQVAKLAMNELEEVVIDFKGVEVLGSSGIGKLLLIYKNLAMNGGKLSVINLAGHLFELFKELKLDTIFSVSGR